MRSFASYDYAHQVKENDIEWECSKNKGEQEESYRILVGKPEGKRPVGRQNVDGWIILRWILDK
jgi:hypothetical protein